MKIGFLLRNLNLKSPVLNGLTGLAGFAAGVLMAGLIALDQTPPSQAAESPSLPASTVDGSKAEPIPVEVPAQAAAAAPWAFEAATAAAARDPGKGRPDRLSAPDGWTYAAGGPAE
ncbi:MAG TPA: hypothetical protein VH278_14310 [Burkholderiaceae bacterium]|nr:hypothetical protein [Burkholderiaceae bacterium]